LNKVYIKDAAAAMKHRETEKYATTGLYCFHTSIMRGTDLKLMKDAHVFIVGLTKDFSLDETTQMLGRGTRSFGVSQGTYYSVTAQKQGNLKKYLKTLEPNFRDGAKHLKQLYARWATMSQDNKSLMMLMFKANDWMITKSYMQDHYSSVFKVLYPDEDREQSNLT
jgi:hypothetical protein